MTAGKISIALVAATGAALAGFLVWNSAAGTTGVLPYTDPAAIAQGETLYAAHCAACHGAALEGEPNWREPKPNGRMPAPPHDESGHTWHHPDAQLVEITTRGTAQLVGGDYESDMMGFGEILSDAEILAVLAYIKSTWPPRVIDTHNRINAGG